MFVYVKIEYIRDKNEKFFEKIEVDISKNFNESN